MNGDWTSFQPTPAGEKEHGGTPEEFIAAWRYLVTYLRDRGATNLRWVFNPTTDTYEGTTDIRTIYPGDDYVDVLGLDGYNWGNTGLSWGQWRTFEDIYREQYDRLVALHLVGGRLRRVSRDGRVGAPAGVLRTTGASPRLARPVPGHG